MTLDPAHCKPAAVPVLSEEQLRAEKAKVGILCGAESLRL